MRKFKELTNEEFKKIVLRSEKMLHEFSDYIETVEMDWLSEKLRCLKSSLSNWSIGFYEESYICVRDYSDFLDDVIKCQKAYGASERCEKLISRCEKLRGTNLFEYYARILEECFFQDEFKSAIDYVNDATYEVFNKEIGKKSEDYIECFRLVYDDYLWDEENFTYWKPVRLSA